MLNQHGYYSVKLANPQFLTQYTGFNPVVSTSTSYYVVPVVEQGLAVTSANPVAVFVNDINPGSVANLQLKLSGMQWARKVDCNVPALQDSLNSLTKGNVSVSVQSLSSIANSNCIQYDQGPDVVIAQKFTIQIVGLVMYGVGVLSLLCTCCLGIACAWIFDAETLAKLTKQLQEGEDKKQ